MKRIVALIAFIGFYLGEILRSNLRVAYDVLTPRHHMNPAIVAVDIEGMTEGQAVSMANFITMTPGTLGIAISQDRRTLFIHCMYIDGSPEEVASALEKDYGRRVRRAFR
ncbi:Na+/H+ antiporter subunit E [Puniceicoccus vermicola]|uniref:Na+/H+ antiporter subunit E n=1 Tax=Puniceicoccus vermicola TaxID=388746 RepID=A0A7X1AZY2_9BACT|nr:Na+/H+ antiporter subunit E [Puniceicoccus vermicola]MBC2603027.1 Na+/H+ antiporter subunit E [Puniceicoccus vermicola]